jgi:hypothetical protein
MITNQEALEQEKITQEYMDHFYRFMTLYNFQMITQLFFDGCVEEKKTAIKNLIDQWEASSQGEINKSIENFEDSKKDRGLMPEHMIKAQEEKIESKIERHKQALEDAKIRLRYSTSIVDDYKKDQ